MSLQSRGPLDGCWDRMRLEQVLVNIVWNAIRYAPGGPIEVSLAGSEGEVVLEVADRGPGIPPAALPHIFQRFTRGEARHGGGLGLGLYLARGIVEAHGGDLRAHNREGGGASFVVRLPRRLQASEAGHAQPVPAEPDGVGR